jgi:plastocyanin
MFLRPALIACMAAWLGLTASAAHAGTVQIVIDKMAFEPAAATARMGDTIEWINNDILAHTATASKGGWSVTMASKQSGKVILKDAGDFEYFCKFHPNMKGRVVVTP